MAEKMKFIRKNGKVIPIGPDKKGNSKGKTRKKAERNSLVKSGKRGGQTDVGPEKTRKQRQAEDAKNAGPLSKGFLERRKFKTRNLGRTGLLAGFATGLVGKKGSLVKAAFGAFVGGAIGSKIKVRKLKKNENKKRAARQMASSV
jgi:hypothetical protein